jgi:ABC-2 type transport system ATP-binding protein
MIMRIIYPDQGVVRVLGAEQFGAANDRVGYLPEERSTYKKMKVGEVLAYHAELKGIKRPAQQVREWLDRFGLADWHGKKVETLSKGMAQKVQFIASVIAQPQLLLLDEPFSGLDPVNNDIIRQTILDLHRSGTTIIFSTHDMRTAELLCDYIFMIYRGDKVLDGTLESIQDEYGTDVIRVRFDGDLRSLEELARLPGVVQVTNLGSMQELRIERGLDTQPLLLQLCQIGRIRHFEISRPSLHDIFVRIANPTTEETVLPSVGEIKGE